LTWQSIIAADIASGVRASILDGAFTAGGSSDAVAVAASVGSVVQPVSGAGQQQ